MYWGRDKIEALQCDACGGRMLLSRRAPHPALPPGSELRSFECPECGHVKTLAVEILPEKKAG